MFVLSILIPKLILKGAIKTFVIKPLLSASASVIPSKVVCDATLLGYHSQILTTDLYKFGVDHILDKFLDKKLDFKIKKLTKYQFEIEPTNDWARLFIQLGEFSKFDRIVIDMRKFDKEIELLTQQALLEMEGIETVLDQENDAFLSEFEDDLEEIDAILSQQINQLNNLIIVDPKIKSIPDQKAKKKQILKL